MSRKQVVVLSSYRFWPVQDGGHQRNWNLYVGLEEKYDVTVVAIDWSGESKFRKTKAGSHLIAYSPPNEVIVAARLLEPQVGFHSWDMMTTLLSQEFDSLNEILTRLNLQTDLVILSRPWLVPLLVNFKNKPVILDLHDIEADFVTDRMPHIHEFTLNLQSMAIDSADVVTLCSKRDLESLSLIDQQKSFVVSNGFQFIDTSEHRGLDTRNVVFVGSGHKPNVDACQRIYKIAKRLPKYNFSIIGSASKHPDLSSPPSNVRLMGFLENDELQSVLENALCFINPMDGGSGSSLKIAQALSFGLPIISTEFGMRGFENLSKKAWLNAEEDDDFALRIEELAGEKETWLRISKLSRHQSGLFDWKNIRKDFEHIVENLLTCVQDERIGDNRFKSLSAMNRELNNFSIDAVRYLNKDVKTVLIQGYHSLPTWLQSTIRKILGIRFINQKLRKALPVFLKFLRFTYSWDAKTSLSKVNLSYRRLREQQS
jgi:glycosyltransferase involved in cell wall biosynthesis